MVAAPRIVELGPLSRARVWALARRLDEERRGVALLDGEGWGELTLAVDPIDETRVAIGRGALARVATAIAQAARQTGSGWNGDRSGARWIGTVAYEAARELERPEWTRGGGLDDRPAPIGDAAVLRRYGASLRRDPRTGVAAVEGDDPASVRRLVDEVRAERAAPTAPAPLSLAPLDDDEQHRRRVEAAIALIARGDLYLVNLAREFAGESDATPTALLAALLSRTTAPYAAALDLGDHVVASASPELFLRTTHDERGRVHVRTAPIKGTRPRGDDAASDRRASLELDVDPKERAELTMVVDLERNDLGRVARVGTVRTRGDARVVATRTVLHRFQEVGAWLADGATIGDLVGATLPSGSVSGAPKVRAMEVIATLEATRRGLYCGAVVRLDRGGDLTAAMAIRTVVQRGGEARAHAGGGIVADSVPAREVAETVWKTRQLRHPSPRG